MSNSLRIRFTLILYAINILEALLIFVIACIPHSALRIVIGFPFVLFFPGYTFLAAIYPRTGSLNGIERLAISFGLSIAIVPLVMLLLNYTYWGIRVDSILISLTAFITTCSTIGWYRQLKLPSSEKITVSIKLPSWGKQSLMNKTLSIVAAVVILGAIGVSGYIIAKQDGARYTEFYILDRYGKAGYPSDIEFGQAGTVIIGIVNHERAEMRYRVEIKIAGITNNTINAITLQPGEKFENTASFTPVSVSNGQKIEFLLFREGQDTAYRELQLWVNVIQ